MRSKRGQNGSRAPRRLAWLFLFLGVAQIGSATATVYLLFARGLEKVSYSAAVLTALLTVLSITLKISMRNSRGRSGY